MDKGRRRLLKNVQSPYLSRWTKTDVCLYSIYRDSSHIQQHLIPLGSSIISNIRFCQRLIFFFNLLNLRHQRKEVHFHAHLQHAHSSMIYAL